MADGICMVKLKFCMSDYTVQRRLGDLRNIHGQKAIIIMIVSVNVSIIVMFAAE